jgi:PKD repeat protein
MTASAEWSARLYHSSVVMPDGSIILMGGMGGRDGGSLTNDVWRSVDNGATWTLMTASAEWSTRSSHTSIAMPDGSIVLMGGYNYGYINDVWRSTNYGAKWTQVTASAGWTARSYHSSVAMPDGSIVLMDGWDGSRFKSDVWRLMPAGSSVQNPSHTYTTPGIYPVGLQTYNANGYTITLKNGYITVTSPVNPPVAALSGTPTSGNAPLTVQFTDTSSGSPTAWKWEYNSSSGWIQFSTIQNPAYTFSAGNYNIRLTATNAGGSSIETKIGYIIVNTGSATAAITSVSPVMTVAGRAAFPLTVKGKKFTMQSTVQWNGSERTTTYVRPTQLKAVINANDIQTGGIALIQVYDPVRGTSNTASFTIKNLPPRITSLTPRRIPDMSPDTDVAVVGKNFNEQSVVLWNGETQTTRCISGTNLYFTINGTKLQIPGRANATVFNPTPGGGVSGNRIFIIGKPI